jgi:formylglycine-generating enzyme required for sulfatase activity
MLLFLALFAALSIARAEAQDTKAAPSTPSASPSEPSPKAPKKKRRVKPAAARVKPVKPSCNPPVQGPSPVPFAVWQDCADTPEMITIPGGHFQMGELAATGLMYERPIREVAVRPFAIGRFEVTFNEWDACHDDGFCQKSPDDNAWGRGFHPVINISWLDAQQYVTWLSRKTGQRYRLPSEAEWEYAARGGTETSYPWGDSQNSICDYANTLDIAGRTARPRWFWSTYCVDGYTFTAPVGSFPPNPWGLYDTQGNVWEWVQDCWHNDYTDAPTDGSAWVEGGDCSKRVNRGGGWGNNPRTVRAAKRDADAADGYGDAFGFRVVRDLPPDFIAPTVVEPPATPDGSTTAPSSDPAGP